MIVVNDLGGGVQSHNLHGLDPLGLSLHDLDPLEAGADYRN